MISGKALYFEGEGYDMKVERLLLLAALIAAATLSGPQAALAQATGASSLGASDITPTEEPASSPWGWLKMPTLTMPKLTMPKMPADPLAPIKSSARKVGDGTKKAWEGTKEMFTFGGAKTPPAQQTRVASNAEAPSMMQRMFGGGTEEKPAEGPATVGEWMAQPRVD
jgi:hypothetical protein